MRGMMIDRETGDLLIDAGHIAIGDTEAQTAEAVVRAMRGEFKESPALGGEAGKQLAGNSDVLWAGRVKKMLRACGVECNKISVSNDVITIE